MSLKKAKIKVQLFLVVLASLFFAFFICNTVFATSDPLTVTLSISSGFTDYSRIRVNGNITGSVGGNPRVTIYWGTTDGGRVPGNWQHSSAPTNPPQPQPISNFINDFYGLTSGVKYYFSASAENSAGISWPSAPLTFTDYYTGWRMVPDHALYEPRRRRRWRPDL